MFKLIVFISGNGTNLEAIMNCCETGVLNAEVGLVVSNKLNAYGLQRATNHNVKNIALPYDKKKYTKRQEYDCMLANTIDGYDYDLIILAGWMHIFTNEFLNNVKSLVINLHPALPGKFLGKDAIGMAWKAFQRGEITKTGMMVHHVIEKIDAGNVIDTFEVSIKPNDTENILQERVRYYEKFLLISSIDKVLSEL